MMDEEKDVADDEWVNSHYNPDLEAWSSFGQTILGWVFVIVAIPTLLFLILWVLHHFGYHP